MSDPDKNFQCQACINYANGYCFEHLRKVRYSELCPEFFPIWEDV